MAMLPPGFRFHPTDAELVGYYLVKKVRGQRIEFDVVADVDLYKCEPWDLPDKSRIPSHDLEWFFFSPRDKKYPNGSRTNRATEKGYWKATGRDRNVKVKSKVNGMKKTLVYYRGRAPNGERTDWLMHEYRLEGEPCDETSSQDGYVLCRVFKKSALDHNIKSSKQPAHSTLGPARHDAEDSVFLEYDEKPRLGVLPMPTLMAEPLSESQVVEDDDVSEEVTTPVYPSESFIKDVHTTPPVAVSPASSIEYESEWVVPFVGNTALKNTVTQGMQSDLPLWDDGEMELPIFTDLLDMDLPDLVIDSPIMCSDYDSPTVEPEYKGSVFEALLTQSAVDPIAFGDDNSSTGIVIKTSAFASSPAPLSRPGGGARRKSQLKRSVRCPVEISSEEQKASTTPVQSSLPEVDAKDHEIVNDDAEKHGKASEGAVVIVEKFKSEESERSESETANEESDGEIVVQGYQLPAETMNKSPAASDKSAEPVARTESSSTIVHADGNSELSGESHNPVNDSRDIAEQQSERALSKTTDLNYIERGIMTPAAGLLNFTLTIFIESDSSVPLPSASKAGSVNLEAVVGSSSGNFTIRLVFVPDTHPPADEYGEKNHTKSVDKRLVQNLLTAPIDDVSSKPQDAGNEGIESKFSIAYFMLFVYTLGSIVPQLVRHMSNSQSGSQWTPSRVADER